MLFPFVKAILAIPLIFLVPGYLAHRLLSPKEEENNIALDFSETAFVCVLASIIISSWFALVLAELGRFSLFNLLLLLVGFSLISLLAFRERFNLRFARPQLDWHGAALLAVLMLATGLFFRPHEFILGGADAGVYVNTGMNLARTGSLIIHDDLLADVPEDAFPEFFRSMPSENAATWLRFPGYYIDDPSTGKVTPQFLHLQSLWIAVFYSLFGLKLGLLATPFFGLMGVISIYFAARAMFNRDLAILAAFLLAINPTQIWFSRYPTSEALTQFLILSAVYAFASYIRTSSPYLGLLGGTVLGTIFLARIDVLPLLIPVVAYLVYLRLTRGLKRGHAYFFLSLALVLSWAAFHAFTFSRPYTLDLARFLVLVPRLALNIDSIYLVFAGVGIIVGLAILDRHPDKVIAAANRLLVHRRSLTIVMAAMLAIAAFYAYFIRPVVGTPKTFFYWYDNQTLHAYDHENLVRIGWYISPLGVLMATLGGIRIIYRELSGKTLLFVSIAVIFSVFYVWNIWSNPHHIYTMRRYVPVVMPAFMISISYALLWLYRSFPFAPLGKWMAIILGIALIGLIGYADRIVVRHVEYAGAIDQVGAIARELGKDDVIVFIDVDVGNMVGTPLQYVFGKPVFVLQKGEPDLDKVGTVLKKWRLNGRTISWMVANSLAPPPKGFTFTPVKEFFIDVPYLEHSYEHFPTKVNRLLIPLTLYELDYAKTVESSEVIPELIDVGASDYGFLVRGFHGKEQMPDGTTFRWTNGIGRVVLSRPSTGDLRLDLSVASGRPPQAPLAKLSVWVNGVLVGEQTLVHDHTFEIWNLTVPEDYLPAISEVEIELRSDTWVPQAIGYNEDPRELGVMVDWIKIVP
jgi:hypothetical protein